MKPESRTKLIDRAWDKAAKQCFEKIKSEPNTKELRDLVYILEHLNNMLRPSQPQGDSQRIEVVFDGAGEPAWNE